MRIYIVIPAYNEAEFISQTLQSLVDQTFLPAKIVVVNDSSTDETASIASSFAEKYEFISLVHTTSKSATHAPGSKVIHAFNKGLSCLDQNFDLICKFDADLIFPPNYLETIMGHFKEESRIGIAGGFCTIKKDQQWETESLTGKDHIRGALKAYRKECFIQIGKLKPHMGWDTVDELLAQYHGWQIKTDANLLVKHLKPTGASYTVSSGFKQGEAFYRLRYGFIITTIASGKLAFLKKEPKLFKDYITGYFKAKKEKQPFLVSEEEGRFIRKLRRKKMLAKLF
ncbi:glycosyltransferase family 2 protein [Antarcticibacterium arcticum]|uniref:Glycosyltransferase family 2 protein n=1 Tax=Antarcticibacterium arcticum TaxID=2585771 RepID=A0A5B8YRQ0_9FLAO|nr:glycosyltransferase [Antarcticibacterium arcticum]QED38829.1 glycosyltransferase family 2 protein [Antarcticibacterium arcticum]